MVSGKHLGENHLLILPDSAISDPTGDPAFVHIGESTIDQPQLPNGKPAISRDAAISAAQRCGLGRLVGAPGVEVVAKYGRARQKAFEPLLFDRITVWAVKGFGPGFDMEGTMGGRLDQGVTLVDAATGQCDESYYWASRSASRLCRKPHTKGSKFQSCALVAARLVSRKH